MGYGRPQIVSTADGLKLDELKSHFFVAFTATASRKKKKKLYRSEAHNPLRPRKEGELPACLKDMQMTGLRLEDSLMQRS